MAKVTKPSSYVAVEPINHDGTEYAPGDVIDLDEAAAKQLLLAGAIVIGVSASLDVEPAE